MGRSAATALLLVLSILHVAKALIPSAPVARRSVFHRPASSSTSSVVRLPTHLCSDASDSPPSSPSAVVSEQERRAALKAQADVEPPPKSFFQLQKQAYAAAKLAISDGERLLEVEFPPLPASQLEADEVGAYQVTQANVRLALDFARSFSEDGKKLCILMPDEAERNIAVESLDEGYEQGADCTPMPGVTISSLRVSDPDDKRWIKPEQIFLNLFGTPSGQVNARPGTDIYVILVASAQELPDVEQLHQLDTDATIVFFNLKLDVLRGDLGAPAFPPKEFQDRFLSRVKPVYYLRTRQYSRSMATPPFLLNYQGALYRKYPGKFQTLLDTGGGSYRTVQSSDIRPGLGEFKEQLTQSLQATGVIEEEGKTLSFLRTGYKTQTWWEEERPEAFMGWRT